MRAWILVLLLVAPNLADDALEAEFVVALKADLTAGKAEQTLSMIAPELKDKLSAAQLDPVYAMWKVHGEVLSLTRDVNTPFALGKQVRFELRQPKQETDVLVTFNADGKIVSYWFRPAPQKLSLDAIDEICAKWKGDCAYARWSGGDLRKVERPEQNGYPLGSIFKLYVLAELARQVEAGTVKLDKRVKIREEWKSLPSGVLHLKPAGTEVTVDELATKMISISDNTATDHLVHLLGRNNIEAGLEKWNNSCAARNKPFLTTREMFLIKGAGNEVQATGMDFKVLCEKWKDADRDTRLGWVEKITAPYEKKEIPDFLATVATGYALRSGAQSRHLTIEWFADAQDIVDLLIAAWSRKIPGAGTFLKYYATGSEIYPRAGLKYYGFKGGSETNVMAMSALAVRADGHAVAVCVCRRGDIGSDSGAQVAKVAAALLREGLER